MSVTQEINSVLVARNQEILRRHAAGESAASIGRSIGLGRCQVSKIVHRNGLAFHQGRRRDLKLVEQARRMYAAGLTLDSIARHIGLTRSCVSYWRREYQWPPRKPTSGPRRYWRPDPAQQPLNLVWRCPCDPRQLHKAGEACKCGNVPGWAEAS